jgi:hypothetical protein
MRMNYVQKSKYIYLHFFRNLGEERQIPRLPLPDGVTEVSNFLYHL